MRSPFAITLAAALLLVGCEKDQWDDCVTSTGPQRSEQRHTGAYHSIRLEDHIDLLLTDQASGTVVVEAGRNLLGQIATEVSAGQLLIRDRNRCNWVRSMKPRISVRVALHDVQQLELYGSGNVSATDTIRRSFFKVDQNGGYGDTRLAVVTDSCAFELRSGGGNVSCSGSTRSLKLFVSGTAQLHASGLKSRNTWAANHATSSLSCNASEYLWARLEHTGDLVYSGAPMRIDTLRTGSGRFQAQ